MQLPSLSFHVKYLDYDGNFHDTYCKMGFWTGRPFWEEEPARPTSKINLPKDMVEPTDVNLKEREQELLKELAEIRQRKNQAKTTRE
jgi:hypothetical protein